MEDNDRPCRGCGGGPLELFLDLGDMPLAGGFLAGPDAIAEEKLYPLRVFVCTKCSLVQIVDVVDPGVLFQDYSFSSSTVRPLVDHFEGYANWLAETLAPHRVVEFGCNDGILLEPLGRLDIDARGVDVSENITDMARSRGLKVHTGFFDRDMAESLKSEMGAVDVVTGSNAFAHNDDPREILEASRIILEPTGHLVLEVMYAGDLLEAMQWDTLYHEHLTFYSLATLTRLLEDNGFRVVHAERLPMHGGSLRVAASVDGQAEPDDTVAQLQEHEDKLSLNDPATWAAFGRQVGRKIAIVCDTFADLSQSRRIWAYGAAGKATMWVNACDMDYLEAIVDSSPLRAGKLMPGTHTPIVFPDELRKSPPDHVFITAWNYAPHIQAQEAWYEGTWSTPLPELRFF